MLVVEIFKKRRFFIITKIDCSMIYAVYTTKSFDRETTKLPQNDRERIEKIFLQLKENPYASEQLRYRNLREKRIKEKRVYFLVYDDLQAVLVVAISGKKDQQATINHIINNFDEYQKYLERIIKKD